MIIPPGYRLLIQGELADLRTDYCCATLKYPNGGFLIDEEWRPVMGIHGSMIMDDGLTSHREKYAVIRPVESTPKPDKEWLNPWD